MAVPDLHVHTNASDGSFSPSEVVRRAADKGIDILSVTDHDTLLGLEEAHQHAVGRGILLFPGVEIGACGDREVHILGYFVHSAMERLATLLQRLALDRAQRAEAFARKLERLGIALGPWWKALPAGVSFSRPLLAKALLEAGHVRSVAEAFDTLIGVGKPSYVPRLHIPAEEVITALVQDGAIPVLAHPGLVWDSLCVPNELEAWEEAGLMGIEAFHPAHDTETCLWFEALARKRGLLVTGGSDFHDGLPPHGDLGQMNAVWKNHDVDALALAERAATTRGKGYPTCSRATGH